MTDPKQPQFMPLVQLPSGVCVRPDLIVFIARKELNQFILFMNGTPANPHVDGKDLDCLRRLGVVQVPTLEETGGEPEAPAAANDDKKIEIAT